MNVDNGRLYFTPEEIAAAKARGENLVEFDATADEAEEKAERHRKFLDGFPILKEYTPVDYARRLRR